MLVITLFTDACTDPLAQDLIKNRPGQKGFRATIADKQTEAKVSTQTWRNRFDFSCRHTLMRTGTTRTR